MHAVDFLGRIPDHVFIQIFRQFNSNELLQLRLLSKRIHRRIQANASYLERPSLEHLSIRMGQSRKRSKSGIKKQLRIEMRKHSRKPARFFELCFHETDSNVLNFVRDHISQFKLTNSLFFSGCDINSDLLHLFIHPSTDLSSITRLSFELCELKAPEAEFFEFIKRTSCSNLTVEFCSDPTATLTSTKFLQHIKNLENLRAQTRSPLDCAEIDDSILETWCKQSILPSTIDLNNLPVQFTVDGVLKAIRTLQLANKNNLDLLWNLGNCQWTAIELISRIQQESREQTNHYSLCLQYQPNNRIGVKINFNQTTGNGFKSPLNALESFVRLFDTNKQANRCELSFSLPNRSS